MKYDALYRKATWRLLPLLMLGYVMAYLDRVNVGFAKLQMLDELGFSEAVYGLGAAIFFIGYFLFEVPSNLIMHKVGAKRWLARIMFTWAILSGSCMFINSVESFYILRFLLGVAEAGFFPGIILYITYWYPAERQSSIIGMFMMGIPLSGIIGGPVSGAIMHGMDGVNGWSGWQWMFLLEAIPTFLLGFLFLKWVPNGPQDAKFLNDYERSVILSSVEARTKEHHSLKQTFSNPHVWKLAGIFFCQIMGMYGFTFWLPSLVKELGFVGMRNIGLISAIPYLCAIFSIILITRHSDAHNERHWHHTFCVMLGVMGILTYIWGSVQGAPYVAVGGLSLAATGMLVLGPLFWPIANRFYSGVGSAAAIAAIGACANLAGFVSPYLIGYTKDLTGTVNYGLLVIIGSIITGTICLHRTKGWRAVR